MAFQISLFHLYIRKRSQNSHLILQPIFINQIPKVFPIPGNFQLLLKAAAGRYAISRHAHMGIGKLFQDFRHSLKQIMKALQRIIPLAGKNFKRPAALPIPAALIETGTHGLIHLMIVQLRIAGKRTCPVKLRPSCHMPASLQHLAFPFSPDTELLLLLPQAVFSQDIPERGFPLYLRREIRHVAFRAFPYQSLDTHQDPFRPAEAFHHREGMGELRSENMDQIRPEIFQDLLKPLLHAAVIDLRPLQILTETIYRHFFFPIWPSCMICLKLLQRYFLLQPGKLSLRRETDGKLHRIPVFCPKSVQGACKPSLPHAVALSQGRRHGRRADITQP